MALKTFLMENDEKAYQFFIADAFESIIRAFVCIDMNQPDQLATFDALTKEAQERSVAFFTVVVQRDIKLTTPVAALCVGNVIFNWKDAAPYLGSFLGTLEVLWKDDESPDAALLNDVMNALAALATLEQEHPPSLASLTRIIECLQQTASELEKRGKHEDGLACAMSAINFAGRVSPFEGEKACVFALSLAKRGENLAAFSVLLPQRAHFLAQIAENDPSRRLDAFDAFEAALAYMSGNQPGKHPMLELIGNWIDQKDYLRILKLTFLLIEDSPRLSDPAMRAGIAAAVNTIWSGTLPEWVKHLDYVQGLSIETANARANLMPKVESSIRAVWNTWSIQHTRLRRAIPHGSSIKREKFLHDILLELSHEVTHVFSMFGFIGIALTAMRWALLEMEIDVWARISYKYDQKLTAENFRVTPAPLQEADLLALGFTERGVELERKIQLVENTWAPWFEGVAVFGELTADPELDKEWQSPVAEVVNNLWDRSLATEAANEHTSVAEVHARDRAESDALYAAAIRSRSEFRLRTYLTRSREKYLAGYMAVRSVVAQWRKTLARPLRGDQAFRVLLHMTRFGDFAAIPDMSLGLEDFEKEVVSRHLEWVRSMATVSKEDLEKLLKNDQSPRDVRKPMRWVGGKLKTLAEEEQTDWQVVTALAEQCLSSLIGKHASVARVPDANEICQAVMEAVAEGLEGKKQESRMFKPELAQQIFPRLVVLPLAQTASMFWLCEKDHTLACLICSRERDSESGTPSYDLLTYPLDEEQFVSLNAKVQKGGPRRMTVTRVIDLLDGFEDRYVGANFIVFQYEDWTLIQPRGVLFGLQKVNESLHDAIIDRLSPRTIIVDQEELTGESHPSVQRTISWIERNDWTAVDTEQGWSTDIHAWAQRVHSVGKQVLSANTADVDKTSHALLRFVFGDSELAKTIETDGFEALTNTDPPVLQDFLKALLKTATTPVIDEQFESMNQTITETLGPVFERTANGWDVVTPKALE